MIRFKVVRASRLLLIAAIVLLAAALSLLVVRYLNSDVRTPSRGAANLVRNAAEDETKTTVVFASSNLSDGRIFDADTDSIEIEILERATPAPETQHVLIYHTHTHEAYEQVSNDPYVALEAWRTNDADHSVVRVGEELARRLRERGFVVVHDVTDYEADELSTAYTRSAQALEAVQTRYDLYIDLHRDAYVDGQPLAFTTSGGESAAQLMMLIGNGNGFDVKPYYEQNLAFANALEKRINAIEPGLCKPVLVKDGRYNQHAGVFSVLVEVGHNHNTLNQALNAVPYLSDALYSLMVENPDAELTRMKADYISQNLSVRKSNQNA